MKNCSICGKEKRDKEMLTVGYGAENSEYYCSCSCIMQSGHSEPVKLELMMMFEESSPLNELE